MPSVSGAQHRFMTGIAHGMKPRGGIGPSAEVAKEFVHATPEAKRRKFSKALGKRKRSKT